MRINWSISSLLFASLLLASPAVSPAQIAVSVSITIAPPALPVYVQPVCPAPDYVWTPGYWAYDPVDGYYWVPGTWVLAPSPGLLWTPGYWSWRSGGFVWEAGYWARDVGFYGDINYGFGYFGVGYVGGYWNNGVFYYNRSVNNVSGNITNIYNKTVINNTINRVSYNGGTGGTTARPEPAELAAGHDPQRRATPLQMQQQQEARRNRAQFASVNRGRPAVAATPKPGVFSAAGVVRASRAGAPYNAAANRAAANRATPRTENPARNATSQKTPEHPNSAMARTAPEHTIRSHPTPEQAASHPAPKHEAAPQHEAASRPVAKHEAAPQREAASRPVAKHEAVPQHEAASHPAPKHQAAAQHEAASRPVAKHEAAPQHEAASRPVAKHEAAPQHEAASRPPAHPNAPQSEEKRPQ